jgi:hypothetical protein
MSVPRVGDIGTAIIVDMGVDLTGSTDWEFDVRKPSYPETGSEDTWVPEIYDGQSLRYIVETGDFDEIGTYEIVPRGTVDEWSGSGDPVSFRVYGTREE